MLTEFLRFFGILNRYSVIYKVSWDLKKKKDRFEPFRIVWKYEVFKDSLGLKKDL